jgi:hypothetical protein
MNEPDLNRKQEGVRGNGDSMQMQQKTSGATHQSASVSAEGPPVLQAGQHAGGRRTPGPRLWVRLVQVALVLASVSLFQGCWVYSVYSLHEDDSETVFDSSLLGHWKQPEGGCVLLITDGGSGSYQVQYIAPGVRQEDGCLLETGTSAGFQGRLVEVGGQRFLDVMPTERESRHHSIRVHSFFKVTLDAQSLALVPLDPEWLKQAVEGGQVELDALAESDGVHVITATSEELRAFLRDYGDNNEAFPLGPSFVYRRQTS